MRSIVLMLALFTAVGCAAPGGDAREGGAAAPAAERIARSFLARPDGQDWLETVPRAEVGDRFLVHFQPRLRAPAEGPWTLTVAQDGAPAVLRERGVRVDGATGRITMLFQTAQVPDGEYVIRLELEEGGMASGPPQQSFRFAVVTSPS